MEVHALPSKIAPAESHDRKLHFTSVETIKLILIQKNPIKMNTFVTPVEPGYPPVPRDELEDLFQLCRANDWAKVITLQQQKPWLALTPLVMANNITTTLLHQAIISKGDTSLRARLIQGILKRTPQAARLKNGNGSLPLHAIAQRNTKIDAVTKEKLISMLISVYPGGLTEEGGCGMRTPLHIIFTGLYHN